MATKKTTTTPKKNNVNVNDTDYDRFSSGKGTFAKAGTPCPYIKKSAKKGK